MGKSGFSWNEVALGARAPPITPFTRVFTNAATGFARSRALSRLPCGCDPFACQWVFVMPATCADQSPRRRKQDTCQGQESRRNENQANDHVAPSTPAVRHTHPYGCDHSKNHPRDNNPVSRPFEESRNSSGSGDKVDIRAELLAAVRAASW